MNVIHYVYGDNHSGMNHQVKIELGTLRFLYTEASQLETSMIGVGDVDISYIYKLYIYI